jgi:hypothetical protein
MKKILFILLLPILLSAQSNMYLYDSPIKGSAVDLGSPNTTKYMAKTNPVNLDLNETTDRILNSADRDFFTLVNWAVLGDASNKIGRSNVDKHAGTYSMVDTTSVPGSTTNCVNLPYIAFTALGTDANSIYEKYTLELWARGTGIGGSNVIPAASSNFATNGTAWWGAINCSKTYNDIAQDMTVIYTTGTNVFGIISAITQGTYHITFRAKSSTITTKGFNFNGYGNSVYKVISNPNLTTDYQNYEFYIVGTAAAIYVSTATVGDVFTIDDIIYLPITLPSVTRQSDKNNS